MTGTKNGIVTLATQLTMEVNNVHVHMCVCVCAYAQCHSCVCVCIRDAIPLKMALLIIRHPLPND